ncbi:hypothetical protein L7F22_022039 [Adiantum nelumboides]|nr:hypothetical protein [Adiantum nelumboides]
MGKKLVYVSMRILSISLVYASLLTAHSLPLSTKSQWIVDSSTGSRVTLSCVDWASHFTPILAEGLHLHPLESIAHTIATWGFNCVRLSWATRMFTNRTLAEATVSHTFRVLGLETELEAIASFNGKLVGMTSVQAFTEVVKVLGKEGLMVVLDNRIGDGDASFDGENWVQGLQIVASLFKGWPFVVGITLRRQLGWSTDDWIRHMQKGAQAVNTQNSDVLLIYQGLSNGEDLHYLTEMPLPKGLRQKAVYEVLISLKQGEANIPCEAIMRQIRKSYGILSDSTVAYNGPLLVGRIGGLEKSGQSVSEKDTCFVPCLTNFASQSGMNMAVWTLQGSYYLRQGVRNDNETCGLFNHQWTAPRKTTLLQNFQAVHVPFVQDKVKRPHMVLFHPPTSRCVNKVNVNELEMGSCIAASSWKYSPQGLILLDSTYLVIGAQGADRPAILDLQGTQANGPWTFSHNKLSRHFTQVSTTLMGQTLCLDSPNPPTLLTTPCTCMNVPPSMNLGQCKDTQWFILVSRS